MSKFEIRVRKIASVEDHPNADRLSLNRVDGFTVISNKKEDGSHRYEVGDNVLYLPENSLVPEFLLREGYWNEEKGMGYLAGPLGNRVKPVKLRGIVSEGIVFPIEYADSLHVSEFLVAGRSLGFVAISDSNAAVNPLNWDHSETLGISKWEPVIPSSMDGEVFHASGITMNYDVENIKKYPNAFEVGEDVVATEKIHGTNVQIVLVNSDVPNEDYFEGKYVIASKGLGAKGLAFKNTEENRTGNLYVRTLMKYLAHFQKFEIYFSHAKRVHFFGEIYGKGVQDLSYNTNEPKLAIFDIFVDGTPMNYSELTRVCFEMGIDQVPHVYEGPYDEEVLNRLKEGTTSINGAHVKEGLVVKPAIERRDLNGRVSYKFINDAYLLRKGNQTEYQ